MKLKQIIIISMLILFAPLQGNAQQFSGEQQDLMNQIARNCNEMPIIHFPRPKDTIDRELQDFKDSARWFQRDLGKLIAIDPNAEGSMAIVRGKPFKDHLDKCKDIIAKTQLELKKLESVTPSKEAIEVIDKALYFCELANKWIDSPKKYNADYDSIESYYKYYIKDRDKSISLDNRVVKYKESELGECNDVFVKKFLNLKAEHDGAEKVKLAKIEDEKSERRMKQEEIYRQKNNEAKSLGYSGVSGGINSLLDDLNGGYTTINEAQKNLYELESSDRFSVVNVLDEFVIFGSNYNSSEYRQIAIVREKGSYYGEGAEIEDGFYSLVGTEEFVSVLGARTQLVVLKRIK